MDSRGRPGPADSIKIQQGLRLPFALNIGASGVCNGNVGVNVGFLCRLKRPCYEMSKLKGNMLITALLTFHV